jgi:hypothetical protein
MTALRTIALACVFAAGTLSLSACRKASDSAEKEKKAESTATNTAEETKSSRPPPPPVDEGIDVPTEEDFEETAQTQITETSDLNKELDRLEKEIGK